MEEFEEIDMFDLLSFANKKYQESEERELKDKLGKAYMAGFGQGTSQNIGTTNALVKAQEYANFVVNIP
jgi:hypothetical protein